jgi:hypothetical protein
VQTDATGTASCSLTPNQPVGVYALSTSFGGDSFYKSSSATAQFTVTPEETTLQITSSPTLSVGNVVVKAKLLEDGQTPVVGRTVAFSGGGVSATGITDTSGVASAALGLQPGQYQLSASFADDPFYLSANATSQTLYVYQPTQFVIWGGNAGGVAVGQDFTFWGSQWDKQVTGGNYQANAGFKGYASQVSGANWTTGPGNSSSPPNTVATYISVLVSTNISKPSDTITGNVSESVVLRVDNPAGYQPDPGHAGSGVVVALVQ